MKKGISLLLSLLMLLTAGVPIALAGDMDAGSFITPYYERASDVRASITKSGTSAKCAGTIMSMSTTDSILCEYRFPNSLRGGIYE